MNGGQEQRSLGQRIGALFGPEVVALSLVILGVVILVVILLNR